ncbi:MAG: hypothetical protein Q4F31_09880 [Eubacteriales bacterium]|nr:hypothetical protein [Eubacteriales bacterium]
MLSFDTTKNYTLQIILPDQLPVTDSFVPGNMLDNVIEDYKRVHPDFKKIVVYDAYSKECVGIIKRQDLI